MNLPSLSRVELQQVGDHHLLARLNKPEILNVISTQKGRDLLEVFSRLTEDPENIGFIVLTGTDNAFCAGGNLKDRNGMTQAQWQAQHELFERAFVAIMECPTPVIAAVNGAAFGGGLETALCCASFTPLRERASRCQQGKLGIIPSGCGTQNLARAARKHHAIRVRCPSFRR